MFYRERAAGMYAVIPYGLAQVREGGGELQGGEGRGCRRGSWVCFARSLPGLLFVPTPLCISQQLRPRVCRGQVPTLQGSAI